MEQNNEKVRVEDEVVYYPRGLERPAFEFDGKSLYIDDTLDVRMHGKHPLATFGHETAALIDGWAWDILYRNCGGWTEHFERERFESYLRAITDFELHHSDDIERHKNRLPIEEEILRIVTEGGYFKG